jgi:LytS/YehU family sensor histidine kinase
MSRKSYRGVRLSFGYKIVLFAIALMIALASLYFSDQLVKNLKKEEKSRIELWANAYKDILQTDLNEMVNPLSYKIIKNNSTIPVIMTNDRDEIISYANLDSIKAQKKDYLRKQLNEMKLEHKPIVVEFSAKHKNYIYYKDSYLLTQLRNFPFYQLILVVLFVLVAYILLIISKKADDNLIWVGMSKETAHQLGTPISSLIAWVEMMKLRMSDDPMIDEVEKDVKRLELITERFARIGSEPKLSENNIVELINNTIEYLKPRSSSKVKYFFYSDFDVLNVNLNYSLFQWVIENICKNAIDAMSGVGEIKIFLSSDDLRVYVDIQDTGKGLTKKEFKKIFKPGFTTKKYGWGLGLALVKRIIEHYHNGKVYVLESELNKGTKFRIELKK